MEVGAGQTWGRSEAEGGGAPSGQPARPWRAIARGGEGSFHPVPRQKLANGDTLVLGEVVASVKNPLLTRYWIEFEPPVDPPGYHGCWPQGKCGVTAYTLEDALWLVQEYLFMDTEILRVKEVTEDVGLSDLHIRRELRAAAGAPIWRGVWYPFDGYDLWRRDVRSWRTNPSLRRDAKTPAADGTC